MSRVMSVALVILMPLLGSAQTEFPYNPDVDSDGWISVNDLLSLLAIFSAEFTPESWETDSLSAAVVLDGNPSYFDCQQQCHRLEGQWRMADMDAFGRHWDLAAGEAANFWVNTNDKLGVHDFNQFYALYTASGNLYSVEMDDLSEGKGCLCHLQSSPLVPDVITDVSTLEDLEAAMANLEEELETLSASFDSLNQWASSQDPEPWEPHIDWGCGESVQHFGWDYGTIGIGGQCWFAENLRSEVYLDGTPIPSLVPPTEWDTISYGALSHYPLPEWDSLYGRLYNWFAVADERGLCPMGWHVASNDDFWLLGQGLNGSMVAGGALKSGPDDVPPWDGSNSVGFNGTAGGQRNGMIVGSVGDLGEWWTSEDNQEDYTWAMILQTNSLQMNMGNVNKRLGHAVRCVKD